MKNQISLDDLAAFAAVARASSFTAAAKELGTSTSNLSHTIRRLEARSGTSLLQRSSRGVSVTEAGQSLLVKLGPALDRIGSALEDLHSSRNVVSGLLRITATRQAYEAIVRPVLRGFLEAHPHASVEVQIDYGYRDIVADRFDAGIRIGEKLQQDMIAHQAGPDLRMAVVAAPQYLSGRTPINKPKDLLQHRCLNYRLTAAGSIYAWELEREGDTLALQLQGPLTTNEPGLVLEAALDGVGVALLFEHEVAQHIHARRLVHLLPDWTPPFPGFYIYYSSRRQKRPVLTAFLEAVLHRRISAA